MAGVFSVVNHNPGDVDSRTARTYSSPPVGTINSPAALPRDILWVDDEVSPADGTVRLLVYEGFRVDCAPTVAAGLMMARTRKYDGIILDVRLPDGSGLTVLEAMRAERILTPVLVLTGYAALETAVAAMKLGATDVRAKPQFGDDLVTAVSRVVGHGMQACDVAGDAVADDTDMLLHDLALADVGVLRFIAAAAAIREALALDDSSALPGNSNRPGGTSALRRARGILARPVEGEPAVSAKVMEIMTRIQAMATSRPDEQEIADLHAIDRAHMGRRVKKETGVEFGRCRSAAAIQVAARWLATTELAIKHIAKDVGFTFPNQFTREFAQLLGMSPRNFRQRCVRAVERRSQSTGFGQ